MSTWLRRTSLVALVAAGALLLAACGGNGAPVAGDGRQLKCGSQGYAEVEIICELAKALIEHQTDHQVEHVTNLGSALATHEATLAGDLDLNASFTGTHFLGTFEMAMTDEWRDPEAVWQFVHDRLLEDLDLKITRPLGYNNVYALLVKQEVADELGLETTSDVAPYAADWVLGTDDTWQEYPGQGYKEWIETYGFQFKDAVAMDYGLLFLAAANGDVDASMGYSTDGRIPALGLKVLEDDRNFNPPYHGIIVLRNDVVQEHPEVLEAVRALEGRLDTETMAALNARVDVDEQTPRQVAADFLKEQGLID